MRLLPAVALFGFALSASALLTGCHSAFVNATIQNRTAVPVTLVELDYPSASFGTQTLGPGQDFKYRFKVLGSGELKLLWTDQRHQDQRADGPHLDEGAEGTLDVAITPAGVQWKPMLHNNASGNASGASSHP